MSVHKIICSHVIPTLETLPDEYVDMVMTSVPYWGLRDYGEDTATIWGGDKDCEHEWGETLKGKQTGRSDTNDPSSTNFGGWCEWDGGKNNEKGQFCSKCNAWHGQLGLEPTPELYIEHLRMVFAEVKRVLKKTGTCWANIGDTYGSSGGAGGDYNDGGLKEGQPKYKQGSANLPAKCMCLIPERFAFMMIDLGYILRNKIIWHKPNPMPSSVKDRFNTTYEMLYFFSKSGKYWFDLDAVREPYTEPLNRWGGNEVKIPEKTKWKSDDEKAKWCMSGGDRQSRPNPSGKNPGDFWSINTQPFPEAHFAVFPEKLCEKPILAGCPAEVCKHCGMARVRITEPSEEYSELLGYSWHNHENDREMGGGQQKRGQDLERQRKVKHFCNENKQKYETIGWTDCQCEGEDKYEPGIILDPFGGSGTVSIEAEKLGKNSIYIDIKKDYCEMAIKRLKPLVEQTDLTGKQSTIERIGF